MCDVSLYVEERGVEKGRAEERDSIFLTIIKNLMARDPSLTKEQAETLAKALMK